MRNKIRLGLSCIPAFQESYLPLSHLAYRMDTFYNHSHPRIYPYHEKNKSKYNIDTTYIIAFFEAVGFITLEKQAVKK